MKSLIAANWKMNKTCDETVKFIKKLNKMVEDVKDKEMLICPPFTALQALASNAANNIMVGAQNMHYEDKGAFTGEISADMILALNCRYVIIGHSERRQLFSESDEMINKKVLKAVEKGLSVILCVGETIEQRKAGRHMKLVKSQLQSDLKDVKNTDKVVIAYEPIWAIGTGENASPSQAQEMHKFIREVLGEIYNKKIAANIRILYGGSVKPDNIKDLMKKEDINGALVGGASLDPESFAKIVKF